MTNNATSRSILSNLYGLAMLASCLITTSSAGAATDTQNIQALEKQIETIQNQLDEMTTGMAHHATGNTGLPIHGFMDVGFATQSVAAPVPKGFYVGSLSFYLTPNFGDRVKALVEPNFEVTPDGSVVVDLERAQLGYAFNDTLTGWGGRFHTPYGYWNTAFHHGAQMQTSILRPRFLDFEDKGGILPAHIVGVWGTGKHKVENGKFIYDVYAGNGSKIVAKELNPNQAGDNNHQVMLGFNVGYMFSGKLDGLTLAAHGLQGDVDDDSAPPKKTELSVIGGSAVYMANDWEVMGEYYGFNNQNKTTPTGSHNSWAGYLQVGKSIGDWIPYVRLEHTVLDQNDHYFKAQTSGQSYTRQSVGVRYNLNANAALKVELLNSTFAAETGRIASNYRSLFTQYAIGF